MTTWDDSTRKRAEPAQDARPRDFRLRVTEGPDLGREYRVRPDGEPQLVGTSPACDFRLVDEEISRRHASLEVIGGRLHVRDLGSTNGTGVGSISIGEAHLLGGEEIRFARTRLVVVRGSGVGQPELPTTDRFGGFLGGSEQVRRHYPTWARVASSQLPVLIEGETGTGKEVLAEALHAASPRAGGPYVVFDCTAVSPTLVESDLFGHEKGSFTGATGKRDGVFQAAHGGTLLIDEIGDLPLDLQAKLLRVLDRSEVRRVGSDKAVRVDVRILAATRRDLDREVTAGRFRDDLFHRLVVARVEVPPLRKRTGDVTLLARTFWKQSGGDLRELPARLLAQWEDYAWPGNVRELKNAVLRRVALGSFAEEGAHATPKREVLTPALDHGSDVTADVLARKLPLTEARRIVLADFEQRYVAHFLALHGGDLNEAAKTAGVAQRYFRFLRSRQDPKSDD